MADDRPRTPKPVAPAEGRDTRALPLDDAERFVLARVDGVLDDEELSLVCGVSLEKLRTILDKLDSLGLVTFGARTSPARDPAARPPPRAPRPLTPATPRSAPQVEAQVAAARPNVAPYDPADLDEDVEIERTLRQRVLELFHRLESLDHYGVLGVERSADKKAVKRAYFEYASVFHPDKYFRKKLGSFKLKMETIFGRATLAHDVLTDKARRAEYDAYLADQLRARGIEDLLKDALSEMAVAEEAVRQAVPDAMPPLDLSSVAEAPHAAPAARPPAKTVTPTPSRIGSLPPPDAQARRDLLARRLLGNRAPPMRTASAPSVPATTGSSPQVSTTADAMEALKRRYEERVSSARAFQAKKYADNADAALAQNDPVAAANAFRVAASMAPNDAELKRRYDEAQAAADAILSETYTRQAGYEEKSEQWTDAAKSWARVAGARPNEAHSHERAANAMVKANGDLHEAARLAQRACMLEPTSAKNKVTLANVYMAAGLTLNARRELEAAAQLSPQDDTIQALLKRISKTT